MSNRSQEAVTARDTEPRQLRYEQARVALQELIEAERYRPGSLLPSERSLSESLGVSRLTLRRALAQLHENGMLTRSEQGRGWRVRDHRVGEPPNKLLGFTEMARLRGFTPSADLLYRRERPALLDEAEALGVVPGMPILEVRRLRRLDNVPIAIDRSLLPLSRLPWLRELDLAVHSLHGALQDHGVLPTVARVEVSVQDATPEEAGHLGLEPGRGLLRLEGVTTEADGTPLELSRIVYHPERYRLSTVLAR